MAEDTVRGTLTAEHEDADFVRFFRIVQDAASAAGGVFFLWSPECHDGPVGDVWCEDLSGWLIPTSEADAFETLWRSRDPEIWDERFEDVQAFARWSDGGDGKVLITFEFPLRSQGSVAQREGACEMGPIGKVRYVGDYYKVMFERGEVYDLLAIESGPFGMGYRVCSPAFEDDGLFPMSEFELVEQTALK